MMWEQTENLTNRNRHTALQLVTAVPLYIPTSSVYGSLFFTSLPMLLSLVFFFFFIKAILTGVVSHNSFS